MVFDSAGEMASLESSILLVLLGLLLVAHLATVALVWQCKAEMAGHLGPFNGDITEMKAAITELVSIGADLADAVDAITDGEMAQRNRSTGTTPAGGASIGNTMLSLITERMLSGFDGSAIQERAEEGTIHAETNAETPSDDHQSA
jgi:hypothetical protein